MSDTTEQDQEKRREAQRELVRAYKRLFSRDDGRIVLDDLERAFGFRKTSYLMGCAPGDHAFRSGMKEPIRHIHAMKDTQLAPMGTKPKRVRAKSGLAPSP